MTLKKVAHTDLSHEQVAAMARTVLSNTQSLTTDPYILQLRNALLTPIEEYDAACLRERKSQFTEQLRAIDDRRDAIIIAIRSHLIAAIDQYMINPIKAEQAKIVDGLVRMINPDVTRMSYQEESTQIHTLLSGVEKVRTAIERSESVPLFSALAAVQHEFDVLLDTKLKSGEFDGSPRRLKAIRKDITDAVTGIFDYIGTVAKFNPSLYAPAVNAFNTMAEGFATNVQAAKTRAETAEKAASTVAS